MLSDDGLGSIGRFGIAILTILAYPLYNVIYNVYFRPLSHFPGPRIWAASRLPFIRGMIYGTLVYDIERLHQKYGPILRVAPNEITFAKAEAWNDILQARPGHAPFPKDPVWWGRKSGEVQSLLSAGPEDHVRMRKILNHAFTFRELKSQEPMVQTYVALLIEQLREKASAAPMAQWWIWSRGSTTPHSRYHPWITLVFNNVKHSSFLIAARFYPQINTLLRRLIPASLKRMAKDHEAQIHERVDRRLNWEVERPDIMSHIIKPNDKEQKMSLEEIHTNFISFTTAGSETTATVLSGTLNYLATYPDKLAILVEEVRRAFAKEGDITFSALQDLPYLNATIQEGLRLCPPVPVLLPRVVPEGGETVCGMFLPGGTSVSIQMWTMFREPKSFHKSLSFLPERWLPEASSDERSPFFHDQRQAVQTFSVGPRSCMGKHLAWAELRLALARMVWAFDIETAGTPVKWDELRTFLLVEKKPIEFRLRERKTG